MSWIRKSIAWNAWKGKVMTQKMHVYLKNIRFYPQHMEAVPLTVKATKSFELFEAKTASIHREKTN